MNRFTYSYQDMYNTFSVGVALTKRCYVNTFTYEYQDNLVDQSIYPFLHLMAYNYNVTDSASTPIKNGVPIYF